MKTKVPSFPVEQEILKSAHLEVHDTAFAHFRSNAIGEDLEEFETALETELTERYA
jgi:hypothetical protein